MIDPKITKNNFCAVIVGGIFLPNFFARTNIDIIDTSLFQIPLELIELDISYILNSLLMVVFITGCFIVCSVFVSWANHKFRLDTK